MCRSRMKHAIYDFKQKIIVEENGTIKLSVDFPLKAKMIAIYWKRYSIEFIVKYPVLLFHFEVNFITETSAFDIHVYNFRCPEEETNIFKDCIVSSIFTVLPTFNILGCSGSI